MNRENNHTVLRISGIVVTGAIFATIMSLVMQHSQALQAIDNRVISFMESIRTPALTDAVIFITNFGSSKSTIIAVLTIILFLLLRKSFRAALFYFIATAGALGLHITFKSLVERPRPPMRIVNELFYSFPSGHATMSTTLAVITYAVFAPLLNRWQKKLLLVAAIAWPILIGFTRTYLAVHYLSDVVGGMMLALTWTALLLLVFPPYPRHK